MEDILAFDCQIRNPLTNLGMRARMHIDTQATKSVISGQMVRRLGLEILPSPHKRAQVADGKFTPIHGRCFVMELQGVKAGIHAIVIDNASMSADFLLGKDWIRKKNHIDGQANLFDWTTGVGESRRLVRVYGNESLGMSEAISQALREEPLSRRRALKMMKQGARVFQLDICMLDTQDEEGRTLSEEEVEKMGGITQMPDYPVAGPGVPAVTLKDMKDPPTYLDLIALLEKHSGIYQPLPPGLPPYRDFGNVIPLKPDAKPYTGRAFRLSRNELEEYHVQVKEMLKKGYIQKSSSPWAAPVMFVGKKDGGLRLVIDHRRLNSVTVANRWPLPRIDDLFDKLGGCSHFSTLDLQAGYNQCRISEHNEPLTAFRTPFGLFQWKVLSMGLTNAPAAFAAFMARVFEKYLGDFLYVYLDDVIVFSKSREEHLEHLACLRYWRRRSCLSSCPSVRLLSQRWAS